MPSIPQRIASAFAVLCGRYGDVTKMAQDREQSRQSLYREAEQVVDAWTAPSAQSRIDDLQRQLAEQQAQSSPPSAAQAGRGDHPRQTGRVRHGRPGRGSQSQRRPAALASHGGVEKSTPSVPTLGRATLEAGERAGPLLQVLDEKVQPAAAQATADEIFLAANRS